MIKILKTLYLVIILPFVGVYGAVDGFVLAIADVFDSIKNQWRKPGGPWSILD